MLFLRCQTVNLIDLINDLFFLSLHFFLFFFLLINKKSCQSYFIFSFCIGWKKLNIFLFSYNFLFCLLICYLWRHFKCLINSVYSNDKIYACKVEPFYWDLSQILGECNEYLHSPSIFHNYSLFLNHFRISFFPTLV